MNIRTIIRNSVAGASAAMSTVLKPAVRGMTAWKNAASSASPAPSGPSVLGLCHSISAISAVAAHDQRRRQHQHEPRVRRESAHAVDVARSR